MGLHQTSGARSGAARARTARAAALVAVLLAVPAVGCAPEVKSVPAESVAASEAAEAAKAGEAAPAGTSKRDTARKPRRTPTGKATPEPGAGGDRDGRRAGEQQVTAGPVTFVAPSGWQAFDERLLTDAAGTAWVRQVADAMGLTSEQLVATVAATDLMLVSTDGMAQGFADNVNVVSIPGPVPGDEQLRQQFLAVGAGIRGIEHGRTGLGDAVSLAYDLQVGDLAVAGEVVMVEVGGRTTTVTVSALDRDVTRTVAQRVRDTLAAAP
jgi:hypothetical protein